MTQDEAFDLLKLGENVFLTGAAGAGKTYLLNRYIDHLRAHGVEVAVTASTGIAATHLDGRTLHSWSGIGVRDSLTDKDWEKLLRNKRIRRHYTDTGVLVIDEISMLHPHQLDMVDQIARRMRDTARPFGGLQVILCGDFFQLPPVVRRDAGRPRQFAFQSAAWQTGDFKICYLHEQHRQGDDPLMAVLNDIRSGRAGESTKVPLRRRYKREPEGHTRPTRLYARNINVDAINEKELARLNGEEKTFHMESRGFDKLVDGLKKSCLAPETLRLKTGAEVMFVKNATDGSYVNGTRGVVEGFDADSGWPQVKTFDGDFITAGPVDWKQEEGGAVRATIIQVPLRLAWAVTIHKSQGMTLDAAEMDLSDAFEPGMGYVALSRVRALNGLKLLGLNETALSVHADILAQDRAFKQQSARARQDLQQLSDADKQKAQENILINRFQGTLDKTGKPNIQKRPGKSKRVPSHEITRTLLEEKMSLEAIARQRKLTLGTLIGHLEKLQGLGKLPGLDHLKPDMPDEDFQQILDAFRTSEDGRLTSVHKKLDGRYSFEDLRIARLFAW